MWSDDILCVGPELAHLREESLVGDFFGVGPIVDVAEHVGYPACALVAHDGDLDGKVEGGDGFASPSGDKPAAYESGGEGMEAIYERVALRGGHPVAKMSSEHVDGVGLEAGREAVCAASYGGSRGIGLGLIRAIGSVSLATTLNGERHPTVISSPRTLHKNFNSKFEANLVN
ncbi:hypothetical protein VNO80_22892 [Phaseolus coccineus]|uniref:Uncharacterized protein n=1 Tax=Phaseolus coccineus TaxID=3886 RepID=A0AAN9M8T1_PHACN